MEFVSAIPWLWVFAVGGGAVILGLAIAYGTSRNRHRTPAEVLQTEQGTREVYREEDRRPGV